MPMTKEISKSNQEEGNVRASAGEAKANAEGTVLAKAGGEWKEEAYKESALNIEEEVEGNIKFRRISSDLSVWSRVSHDDSEYGLSELQIRSLMDACGYTTEAPNTSIPFAEDASAEAAAKHAVKWESATSAARAQSAPTSAMRSPMGRRSAIDGTQKQFDSVDNHVDDETATEAGSSVTAEISRLQDETEGLRSELAAAEAAKAEAANLRAELATRKVNREELDAAKAEVESLRAELVSSKAEAATLRESVAIPGSSTSEEVHEAGTSRNSFESATSGDESVAENFNSEIVAVSGSANATFSFPRLLGCGLSAMGQTTKLPPVETIHQKAPLEEALLDISPVRFTYEPPVLKPFPRAVACCLRYVAAVPGAVRAAFSFSRMFGGGLPAMGQRTHFLAIETPHQECDLEAPLLDISAARFNYEPPELKPFPRAIACCLKYSFWGFVVSVFAGSAVSLAIRAFLLMRYSGGKRLDLAQLIEDGKLFSIPLVSLLFTWFHVWLALKMMFFPINFWGIGKPIMLPWLDLPCNGWQGIIPRKAHFIADRFCEKVIGNIVTVEEIADRIDPERFWRDIEDIMVSVSSEVLTKIVSDRWPAVWAKLPEMVKTELHVKVLDETKATVIPALYELKRNNKEILDMKAMAIQCMVDNPAMMVDIFQTVASKEITFIAHVAAVMGFALGLAQLVLYVSLQKYRWKYTDYVMLPLSGCILGYFTNWLALKLTFWPIWPHLWCNGRVNLQGVLLQRQAEAADQIAKVVCEKVVHAQGMLQFMLRERPGAGPSAADKIMQIYTRHMDRIVDREIDFINRRGLLPKKISDELDKIKTDVVAISLEQLPPHSQRFEKLLDDAMRIEETMRWRLQRISPAEFEDVIHPMFKQDEWILLLVGGVLGVVIGLMQAYALQNVHG